MALHPTTAGGRALCSFWRLRVNADTLGSELRTSFGKRSLHSDLKAVAKSPSHEQKTEEFGSGNAPAPDGLRATRKPGLDGNCKRSHFFRNAAEQRRPNLAHETETIFPSMAFSRSDAGE